MEVTKKKYGPGNPYAEAGKPKLSYCVFMDILGFSTEVKDSAQQNEAVAHFKKIYTAFIESSKSIRGEDNYSLRGDNNGYNIYQIKMFSDSVLLGAPVTFDFSEAIDDESLFGYMIREIARFQMQMTLAGWFIRGGWAVGDLFMDDNFVYGNGLIEAYEIESKQAVYPMVMFSRLMEKVLQRHLSYYASAADSDHYFDVLHTDDNRYFVNYLSEIYLDRKHIDTNALELHRTNILKRYNEISESPASEKQRDILGKYEWLIDYHNFFVNSYLGTHYTRFLIEKDYGHKIYLLSK